MTIYNTFTKDPNSTLDFAFDWSQWLATGETITSCSVTAGSGIISASPAFTASGSVTTWLSGGTAGERYTVACLIQTSASRIDERSIKIDIKNR